MQKNSKSASKEKRPRISLGTRLRGYFITGLIVTSPFAITIYIIYAFLTMVDAGVAYILPNDWHTALNEYTTIPGLGLLIAIVFFIIVGWFAKNFLGRFIIRLSDEILDRMPVVRKLYKAIKQIIETVMATQSTAFREVVMVEYPRKGVWSVGFVTGKSEGEVQRLTENEMINVFLPTTPNPTSGFLLFVPRHELKFLEMSVEEGIKLVVSAGMISPPDKKLMNKVTQDTAKT